MASSPRVTSASVLVCSLLLFSACGASRDTNRAEKQSLAESVALLVLIDEHPNPHISLDDPDVGGAIVITVPIRRIPLIDSIASRGIGVVPELFKYAREERLRKISLALVGEIVLRRASATGSEVDINVDGIFRVQRNKAGEGLVDANVASINQVNIVEQQIMSWLHAVK